MDSVTRFEKKLNEAILERRWRAADVSVDRLRMALLEAVVSGDAETISRIQDIFSNAGQIVELRDRLKLADDAMGMAHRLRADAGCAVLAGRIRPLLPAESDPVGAGTLRDRLLETLRQSNRPLSNSDLCVRLSKDAPTISRALKALVHDGYLRQWKAGSLRFNTLTERGRGLLPAIQSLVNAKQVIATPSRSIVRPPNEVPRASWPKGHALQKRNNVNDVKEVDINIDDVAFELKQNLSSKLGRIEYVAN